MTASLVSCPSVSCPLLNDPAALRRALAALAAVDAREEAIERERLLLALHHRWPGRTFSFAELKAAMVDGSAVEVFDALPEWQASKVGKREFQPLVAFLGKIVGAPYGEYGARLVRDWDRHKVPLFAVTFDVSAPPLAVSLAGSGVDSGEAF